MLCTHPLNCLLWRGKNSSFLFSLTKVLKCYGHIWFKSGVWRRLSDTSSILKECYEYFRNQFSSVQSLSCVWIFATPWIATRQASLSIISSRSLLKLMPIESVMPSSHLILCHPLLLLPPIPPNIRVFSSESTLHMRWPKYWSFSFSISPSNEYSGLISFRMDWLDLLAVQGTLKSLLQHYSSKASIFLVLSFLYSPTLTSIHDHWKNHGLDQTDLCWHGCKHPRQIGISLINGKNNHSQSILCIQRVLHLVTENHSNIIHHRDIRGTSQQCHSPSWLLTLLFPFFASEKEKKKKKKKSQDGLK